MWTLSYEDRKPRSVVLVRVHAAESFIGMTRRPLSEGPALSPDLEAPAECLRMRQAGPREVHSLRGRKLDNTANKRNFKIFFYILNTVHSVHMSLVFANTNQLFLQQGLFMLQQRELCINVVLF